MKPGFTFQLIFISALTMMLCHPSVAQIIENPNDNYKISFEIKGVDQPSAEWLQAIKLDDLQLLRKSNEDVEVVDAQNHFTIILYSLKKEEAIRAAVQPVHRVDINPSIGSSKMNTSEDPK